MLATEMPSQLHNDLDLYPTEQLVRTLIDDEAHAIEAARAASAQISAAVTAALPRMWAGGRLIYVGAGTSGRLGVLDSVELYPTFSWSKARTQAIVAGGKGAMFESAEGVEDDQEQARADIAALHLHMTDVVLLLSASGDTPWVLAALQAARARGALCIGIANNPQAPLCQQADVGITLATGAELISGSTRLKAATAQKIALNAFSSALMVRLNKVYGNLMVDLKAGNRKLRQRALRLTMHAGRCDEAAAAAMLDACSYQVKTAIVALLSHSNPEQAALKLAQVRGSVRQALARPPGRPRTKVAGKTSTIETHDLHG